MKTLTLILLLALAAVVPAQSGAQALVGGTVLMPDGTYQKGVTVVIDGGRIIAVGKDVKVPDGAKVENLEGKYVYPGLIDLGTDLGLTEIGSVRGTVDTREGGTANPHLKALTAVNPHSELVPVARANGILYAMTGGSGGLLAGQSALIALDGMTSKAMSVSDSTGILVNPSRVRRSDFSEKTEGEMTETRQKAMKRLSDYLERARKWRKARAAWLKNPMGPRVKLDLGYEAMGPVLDGELPLIVNANDVDTILAVLEWAQKEKVKIVLRGCREAWKVADLIAAHQVPCIIGSTFSAPGSEDAYEANYAAAGVLARAGVKIGFCSGSASKVRNLPYAAAMAVSFGMDKGAALKALTSDAAAILGLEKKIGGIAPGREASLFIANGDILDIRSSVEQVIIRGRDVGIETKHTRLRDKFAPTVEQPAR